MIAALKQLQGLVQQFGREAAKRKLDLLARLERKRLRNSVEVARLHDALCFMRAYPDNARVLALTEKMLERFDRRADLLRFRARLADSGIAGTVIRYRFYWPSLQWLGRKHSQALFFAGKESEVAKSIDAVLSQLASLNELKRLRLDRAKGYAALERLKRGGESGAAFFVSRIAVLPGDDKRREALSDGVDANYLIKPGPKSPSRTRAKFLVKPIEYQIGPLRRERPDLDREIAIKPRAVRSATAHESEQLLNLARTMMVTQARDLDAFAYADNRTVQLADCGEGLMFMLNGIVLERQVREKKVHGYLVLKNGVPIGYGDLELRGKEAAVAFNTFPAYRGGEAAWVLSRLLAVTRHVVGSTLFSLAPYQLGHHNEEAVASGAWWFYAKLGFTPCTSEARKIFASEQKRMKANPAYRSSAATLRRLARSSLFFSV